MYEAYKEEEVVSKLRSFEITCIAYYQGTEGEGKIQEKLFIGNKSGQLLSCRQRSNGRGFEYILHKSFEKSAIIELKVVVSHDLILCLNANDYITVHSITESFPVLNTIMKYRPVSAFAFTVIKGKNELLLAVSARKQIHFFKWNGQAFNEIDTLTPLKLSDNVRSMCWFGHNALILTINATFHFMKVLIDTSDSKEEVDNCEKMKHFKALSFKSDSSLLFEISDERCIGLRCDSTVAFVDERGESVGNCTFSDVPTALAYDSPYLLALLPKGIVEVRIMRSSRLIQKIEFKGASIICAGRKGTVYVADNQSACLLNSLSSIRDSVESLINDKQLQPAVVLVDRFPDQINRKCKEQTYWRFARELFIDAKFAECFKCHTKIQTDVFLVMKYVPFLIPEKFLAEKYYLKYSDNDLAFFNVGVSNCTDDEKKMIVLALGDYLAEQRTSYALKISDHYKNYHAGQRNESKVLEKYESNLEFVDTILLKCYIMTKPALISSLLRLSDSKCNVAEAQQDLNMHKKYSELLILYERKRLHEKAISLLKREMDNEESCLYNLEYIVEYLHNLLTTDLNLVFKHAPFVFERDVHSGLQIFTGLYDSTDIILPKLDHEEILQFLGKHCDNDGIMIYLEHIIYRLHEKRPKFHDMLANGYVTKVKELMKDYIHTLADDEMRTRGGEEEGELGTTRSKLIKFMEFSQAYSAENLLEQLDDYLLEEKTILYGRLKQHDKAFSIYANILMDFKAAEKHCAQHYDASDPINSQVYLKLFKAYTSPSDLEDSDFRPKFILQTPQPNITEALKVLRKYPDKIDIVNAISEIPMDAPLARVWESLEAAYVAMKNRATNASIYLAISRTAVKNCDRQLEELRSQRIVIDSSVECKVCLKKIGNSVFVCHPDRSIMHYGCYERTTAVTSTKKSHNSET